MAGGGSLTPWQLSQGLEAAAELEPAAPSQGLALDVDEPLLLVGAFNQWGKGFPQNPLKEFLFEEVAGGGSGPGERESRVCVTHSGSKLSFKVISARRAWAWQIYPRGEGESLKELRLGVRMAAEVSQDHEDKAAHGRNFRIWERAGQAVEVRVLLSRSRGALLWYERAQLERVQRFHDAPHLVSFQEVVRASREPEPLLQGLVRHFGEEGWVHCPKFGTPEETLKEAQKEVASLDALMLPGLTPNDFKQSTKPLPRSRTDRIAWLDEKMLQGLPGLRRLSEALVRFVDVFAKEVQEKGHRLVIKGHNRPMLAVYDEGSFFKQHVDVTSLADPRTLTLVYYFNPGWRQEYGGALRLWPGHGKHVDIWPEMDSLAMFRAEEITHEVRTSKHRRMAMTIWFNRA